MEHPFANFNLLSGNPGSIPEQVKCVHTCVMFSVFQRMLKHLKDKKDVGFFMSVAGLMQQCR